MTVSKNALAGAPSTLNLAVAFIVVLAFVPASTAQSAPSNRGAISLAATLSSQLKLSISDVNLDIAIADPTQQSAAISVPVTSSWVLGPTSNSVELVGFFDVPSSAMMDMAGNAIPADHVLGGVSNTEMAPFSESSAAGTSASRTLFQQQISRTNIAASRTDTLQIQIQPISDLNDPAGEYRGVLHLRLISF